VLPIVQCITKGEIIKNLNKGEFYKYLGINQSNHIQHSITKENLEKQFYLRIKSIFSTIDVESRSLRLHLTTQS
jgi:hypothetical protein